MNKCRSSPVMGVVGFTDRAAPRDRIPISEPLPATECQYQSRSPRHNANIRAAPRDRIPISEPLPATEYQYQRRSPRLTGTLPTLYPYRSLLLKPSGVMKKEEEQG